jgi:ribosome-associated heat shock protein Hsp15
MTDSSKVRLDKYLWAIRIFKTRSQASTAIDAGKVKLHGAPVKSARAVGIGDEYDIKTEARKWIIEVTGIIDARVQYSDAIKNYIDKTPPELLEMQKSSFSFNTGKRMSKSGRPTKKDRRSLDDFL